MKTLIFIIIIISSFSISALACNQSVDNSRVILFVDANNSPREVASAREAACTRGENLVVVNPNDLESRVTQLATNNVAITSLIASGHDGGGHFGGVNGDTTKQEMIDTITTAYEESGNEALLEELQGLYLWGCYTSTPGEVDYWKRNLPNVQFIAGFHGMGPSNTNVTGIRMLRSALVSQQGVQRARSVDQLRAALNGIEGINGTYNGIYINACENLENEYYSNVEPNYQRGSGITTRFRSFGFFSECEEILDEFRGGDPSRWSLAYNYINGRTPIPENTHGTELRELYGFVRQHDYCFTRESVGFEPNQVGLALFYHGIKKNFAKVFASDIQQSQTEISNLRRSVANGSVQLEDGYSVADLQNAIADYWPPTLSNISNKTRAEIDLNTRNLHTINRIAGNIPSMRKTRRLNLDMELYLTYLSNDCMAFLDWHEYSPSRTPSSRCPSGWYADFGDNHYPGAGN